MEDSGKDEYYDDEIDLTKIFLVLWQKKWLVIGTTFLVVILSLIITLNMKKVYRIYAIIQPGIIGETEDGRNIYIDSVENIKTKVESEAYRSRLMGNLKNDPELSEITYSVNYPKGSNMLTVSADIKEDSIDIGVKSLKMLIQELQKDYVGIISQKKDELHKQILVNQNTITDIETQQKDFDQQIAMKRNLIRGKDDQIEAHNANLAIYEKREKDLVQELTEVKKNTDNIIQQRNEFLKAGGVSQDRNLADILYATTIQQSVTFLNDLQNQIKDLKIKKEEEKSLIKTKEKEIDDLNVEIERIKLNKSGFLKTQIERSSIEINDLKRKESELQNIEIITQPYTSPYPIKPRVLLNITLSLFIGLFLGILVAFLSEFVTNARKQYKETKAD